MIPPVFHKNIICVFNYCCFQLTGENNWCILFLAFIDNVYSQKPVFFQAEKKKKPLEILDLKFSCFFCTCLCKLVCMHAVQSCLTTAWYHLMMPTKVRVIILFYLVSSKACYYCLLFFFFHYGLTLAYFWKIKISVSDLKTRVCLVCSCEVSASILAKECAVVVMALLNMPCLGFLSLCLLLWQDFGKSLEDLWIRFLKNAVGIQTLPILLGYNLEELLSTTCPRTCHHYIVLNRIKNPEFSPHSSRKLEKLSSKLQWELELYKRFFGTGTWISNKWWINTMCQIYCLMLG